MLLGFVSVLESFQLFHLRLTLCKELLQRNFLVILCNKYQKKSFISLFCNDFILLSFFFSSSVICFPSHKKQVLHN